MSVILDSTSKSLQLVLGGAVATNQLTCVASWADITSTTMTPGSTQSLSNSTTAVTIVGSPAASTQRQVKNIDIYNADTAGATVTVSYNSGGTLFPMVNIALQSAETLQFSENAWSVINSSGAIVQAYQSAPAGSAGGDLSGSYPNPTVAKLNGITAPGTAPTTGQVLTATSSSTTSWQTLSAGSGSVGGDLSGTLPNPTVAKVNGISVTGTPTTGQVITATSGSAASWQTPTGGGGGVTLDTTATDILPNGVQSAGSTGKAADAGHVHPLQPYQFHVKAYGAKGDGKVVTDAVMSSGSANLACTTSTPFASGDVGKSIMVSTAKGSFANLTSTISTFTDSGHVVLANSATAATGGTPGAIAYFGTDDTSAVQNAINAAVSYAQANNGYAEVVFDPVVYIIAGAFHVGGTTLGNSQLLLPMVSQTAQQVVLAFKGPSDETPLMHWNQLAPQTNGAVLASTRTDGTNDSTYGPAALVGGPYSGYGGEPGTFSNAIIKVSGLATLCPYNATMSGMDLFGMLEADISSFSAMTAAVVPTTSAPAPSLSSTSHISNQWTYGLRMPDTGNQTVCYVGRFSTEGFCYGIGVTEWTHGHDIHAMYCIGAIGVYSKGVSMVHHVLIDHCQAENCSNAIIQVDTGTKRLLITSLGTESISGTNIIYDPSNLLVGEIGLMAQGSASGYQSGGFAGGHGIYLRIVNKMTAPGPISSPAAAPASGSSWPNYYYRDAWITVSATTITALSIDSTAQNGLSSSPATYTFLLPAGHSYTPTYTGTLAHTVTLL